MQTKFIAGAIALVIAGLGLAASATQVDPGHVGIKVSRYGTNAGVDPNSVGMGTYFTMPGTSIVEYATFTNTKTWTRAKAEGDTNEEFTFQDKSGLSVTADVAVAYRTDPAKAPTLYQKYRMDMDAIVAGPLRNAIRSALVEEASQISVEEIYGPKKTQLINRTQAVVQKYFDKFGLVVEQLYWASNIRVPDNIMEQINAKTANEQQALAAAANVATVEADAKAKIAEAEGKARATEIEAAAIRTNPEILQQRAIEKWNGEMPQYLGGNGNLPFLTVK